MDFIGILESIILIVVGFALRGWSQVSQEDKAIRSYFDALGMEVRRCGELAGNFLDHGVKSPLYRLPFDAYRRALPVLSRHGLVSGDAADTLQNFYLHAEQVNRGLDNVDDFLRGKTPPNESQEITYEIERDRLSGKATKLRAAAAGNAAGGLYEEAVTAI